MNAFNIGVFAVAGVIVAGVVWAGYYNYGTVEHDLTVYVQDAERECRNGRDSEGRSTTECRYVVYTEDEVFENTDALLHFKFNSSDVRRVMVEGSTCEIDVYGMRVPFLSMYRNIIEAECAAPPTEDE